MDSKALKVALLSMADVRVDTLVRQRTFFWKTFGKFLVRPISSGLVVVCENVAPDSFCGYWIHRSHVVL